MKTAVIAVYASCSYDGCSMTTVLYYSDLDPESLAYLHRQRGLLLSQIQEATGLHPEVRKEGIALTDSGGDLTDFAYPSPERRDIWHCFSPNTWRIMRARIAMPTIGMTSLVRRTAELIREHRTRWNKEHRCPSAEINMTRETLARLEALRLVRRNETALSFPCCDRPLRRKGCPMKNPDLPHPRKERWQPSAKRPGQPLPLRL